MNKTFITILVVVVFAILYQLSSILTPFLIAFILAYLGDPLVERLMRLRLPRLFSVILVFLLLFSLLMLGIILLIPLVEKQIFTFLEWAPKVLDWIQNTFLPGIQNYLGINEIINFETLKDAIRENWTKAEGVATAVWKSAVHSSVAIAAIILNAFLIPVVTFYLLRDWSDIIKGIKGLLPRSIEPTVVKLAKECDEVLSAFFRGQLLVMMSLALIYSVGLSLVGLQVGVMIGLVSGLLSIVPYLGVIAGILSASTAAFIQFGTFDSVVAVWIVFLVGQSIESMFLTPRLVGPRIGLHPVAVIFAVLTGGTLFGFFGVLLALPVAAVVMVLLRFLNQRYRKSTLYK